PAKKWWLDLEIVDGVCVEPVAGTNQRDIDLSLNTDPAKQKMAYYHADMMPVPNDTHAQPVDRKAALAAAELLETPAEARARKARGEAPPKHYAPTPPAEGGPKGPKFDLKSYGGGSGKPGR
nr:hypothetical protein [Alphaproteobacteria bacterium]